MDTQCKQCIKNNIKRIVRYTFIALFLVYIFIVYSWGVYPYPKLLDRIDDDITKILTNHGIPRSKDRECPFVELSGRPGKYTVSYYQVEEIPFAVKMETIKYFVELYEERGDSERFTFNMYREKKEKNRGIFPSVKPFFEMTIGGNK